MLNRCFKYICISFALFLSGCDALIGRPTVTQLTTDPAIFLLAYPLEFAADDNKERFSVPSGFITDLASIPRGLWWWQAPHEGTMAPAIVHDFLYWEQPCTKDEADAVMYVAMKQSGMGDFSINRVYDGIRTKIAQDAWDKNKAARAKGEPRFFNSDFSKKLVSGNLDAKSTLEIIQAEAIRSKGVLKPTLPHAVIKKVCQTALKELSTLRAF
jgi:hypothetical protein